MKAIVLLSGGIDSSTCLGIATEKHGSENVLALSIYYGQRHDKEIESAKKVAKHYGVEHIEMDMELIFKGADCSLLNGSESKIPEKDYSEQIKESSGSPVSTYVPFRNGLFLSVATCIGLSRGCGEIYYGAHADDSAGNAYPDCSIDFTNAMEKAVKEGSGRQIEIMAPFVGKTKADVIRTGLDIKVPYKYTWSCYKGGKKPCGVCGTCRDRAKAFMKNGVKDPAL